MILTLQEKKLIAKHIIKNQSNMLIREARYDLSMRDEIKLNLVFYNLLKESLSKNNSRKVLTEDLMSLVSALGSVKDFITGLDVVKDLTQWVKDIVAKIVTWLEPAITKFIPKTVVTDISEFSKMVTDGLKSVVSAVASKLSYKGLATLFAAIKYKTFKPTAEQINCMMLSAKSAYSILLMTLVGAFIIKVGLVLTPAVATAFASSSLVTGLVAPLKTLGISQFATTAFSTYSAVAKGKKAAHLKQEIDSMRESETETFIASFKKGWNNCSAG